MLDESVAHAERADVSHQTDDGIDCATCGQLVTRRLWRASRRDTHEHTVFNPAGRLFTIVCFIQAPGVIVHGASSDEFTWFPGYRWTIARCLNCRIHMGWRFDAGDVFFGLIKPHLIERKP